MLSELEDEVEEREAGAVVRLPADVAAVGFIDLRLATSCERLVACDCDCELVGGEGGRPNARIIRGGQRDKNTGGKNRQLESKQWFNILEQSDIFACRL